MPQLRGNEPILGLNRQAFLFVPRGFGSKRMTLEILEVLEVLYDQK
jgi:hypothetical protein